MPCTKPDAFAEIPLRCHCEERSDAAILFFQTVTNFEIASLRSQRRLSKLITRPSNLFSIFSYHVFSSITCYDNLVLLSRHTILATQGMLLYLSSGAMAVSVAVRNKARCRERAFIQPP
jgi:hypothetical protein